jgi:hypothetical protein
VNVRGMLAGGQVLEIERNRNATLRLTNTSGANTLSFGISQLDGDGIVDCARRSDESDHGNSNDVFGHVLLLEAILSRNVLQMDRSRRSL